MSSPYTTLGLPPDRVAWATLGVACIALIPAFHAPTRRALEAKIDVRWLVPALAVCAGLLSAGYVAYYLHGGPRIIDATSYYLQARAMAAGYFAFPVLSPLASFNGRFLLPSPGHSLSVIFPPGYAAVLCLGFWLHAPLVIGPALAGLVALVTYALGRELSGRTEIGEVAAGLSVVCAALRYHTADTMSHGLCALLLATGTYLGLRPRPRDAAFSGLAIGWLMATRPVSGIVGLLLAACLLPPGGRHRGWFAVGLAPGLLLLVVYQHAATGHVFSSMQFAYYALADGPPGCFKYGFGPGIGCMHEHGDYVRSRLASGFGLREAAAVTLRRLALHSIDIANAPPLALLCPIAPWLTGSDRRLRMIFFGCVGLMVAYAPFYFDASYPGGGARLFADLLPLEHVLLAVALVRFGWTVFALPAALIGFSFYASFAHRALAEREGGRPMFETRELKRAGLEHGLVFVATDHGFNLGHDPGQFDARRGIVVARLRHDANDYALWKRLGEPPSFLYSYSPAAAEARPSLLPYTPVRERLRFEAESEWPPLAVAGAWVEPDFFPCASAGAGLRIHPVGQGARNESRVEPGFEFELPGLGSGARELTVGWIREPGSPTTVRLRSSAGTRSRVIAAGGAACLELDFGALEFGDRPTRLRLDASRGGMLDYIETRP